MIFENYKLKNIQEQARLKRYELLFKKCKNYKLNKILTAHHKDDLYENFFMRLLRGSGLNGLISFKKKYSKLKKAELLSLINSYPAPQKNIVQSSNICKNKIVTI